MATQKEQQLQQHYHDQALENTTQASFAKSAQHHQMQGPAHLEIQAQHSWNEVTSWITSTPKSVLLASASHHQVIHSDKSFLLVLPSVSNLNNNFGYNNSSSNNNNNKDENAPDFRNLQNLLGALMLATTLASFSAFDAKNQCRSQAGYDVYDQFLDGNAADDIVTFQDDQFACLQMFRIVVIPVVTTVLGMSLLALWILRRHQSRFETSQLITTTTRLDIHLMRYRTCLRLLAPVILILLSWTYGTVAIMLRPRLRQGNNEEDNPYLSLAAVDQMGHIGANANLYYLCWISVCLCIALFYHCCVDTVRQYGRYRHERSRDSTIVASDAVEAMLSSWTRVQLENYQDRRATWYQSLYRLRIRTGIWTAALLSSLVVMASSVHIWKEVLIPAAQEMNVASFPRVCDSLANTYNPELPPELCARTTISLFSGMVAATMSMIAIGLHLLTRNGAAHIVHVTTDNNDNVCAPTLLSMQDVMPQPRYIPLRSEFVLSLLLVIVLGLNATFATAVQGPAASVGNLYYASWISFLLCLRIGLGCLEEICHIHVEHDEGSNKQNNPDDAITNDSQFGSPSVDGSDTSKSKNSLGTLDEQTDLMENERAQRTRKYLFLGICSTVCSASAVDAAYNQSNPLDFDQLYVLLAPSVVATLSAIQFLLCLHTRTYMTIRRVWCGGILSVMTFGICLPELIIVMHSESSWAVNGIGDVQIANLYYFSWASIITAGLQMMSYLKNLLGLKQDDYVTVVWIAVCKVCFVIFGAGVHIWHTISDTCTLNDIQSGLVTFCSRTIFAIAVSCTGMLVAGLVALCRILVATACPNYFTRRVRAHVEMVVSFFLMLLFGTAVATITGIGGPGQSVGDMFYATWFAFLVTIALVIVCYNEISTEENGVKPVEATNLAPTEP